MIAGCASESSDGVSSELSGEPSDALKSSFAGEMIKKTYYGFSVQKNATGSYVTGPVTSPLCSGF
jgi:hypothetical protein